MSPQHAIAPPSPNQLSTPALCRRANLDGHPVVRRLAAERIEGLYHFTSVENLPMIVATGALLSKQRLQRHHIDPPVPGGNEVSRDLDRRNGNWDFVSLSFTPHIPMAYYKKRESHLCYVVFHPHVAALPGVMFTDRNATDHTHRRAGGTAGLNLIDFAVVRYEHAPDRADWKPLIQAEVLVPAKVDLGCVAYVGFVSEASREEAIRLMVDIPEDARPRLIIAPRLFGEDPRFPTSLRLPRLEMVRAYCSISDKVTLEARVASDEGAKVEVCWHDGSRYCWEWQGRVNTTIKSTCDLRLRRGLAWQVHVAVNGVRWATLRPPFEEPPPCEEPFAF